MSVICGNMVGGTAPIKTIKIIDESDNEILGIVVDNEVIFTATAEDLKLGKVAASDSGIITGTHVCE